MSGPNFEDPLVYKVYSKSFSNWERGAVALVFVIALIGSLGLLFHDHEFGGKWNKITEWMQELTYVKGQEVALRWLIALTMTIVGAAGILMACLEKGSRIRHDLAVKREVYSPPETTFLSDLYGNQGDEGDLDATVVEPWD